MGYLAITERLQFEDDTVYYGRGLTTDTGLQLVCVHSLVQCDTGWTPSAGGYPQRSLHPRLDFRLMLKGLHEKRKRLWKLASSIDCSDTSTTIPPLVSLDDCLVGVSTYFRNPINTARVDQSSNNLRGGNLLQQRPIIEHMVHLLFQHQEQRMRGPMCILTPCEV